MMKWRVILQFLTRFDEEGAMAELLRSCVEGWEGRLIEDVDEGEERSRQIREVGVPMWGLPF